MELCLCPPTGGWKTSYPRGPNVTVDGVGGIPTIFLCSHRTSPDVRMEYIETKISLIPSHKFEHYAVDSPDYTDLPEMAIESKGFGYMVEVYVNNFMSLVIPVSWEQLCHVANTIMHGIHDFFPPV